VPETLPFSGEYRDSDPVISADGRTLYFVSDRPAGPRLVGRTSIGCAAPSTKRETQSSYRSQLTAISTSPPIVPARPLTFTAVVSSTPNISPQKVSARLLTMGATRLKHSLRPMNPSFFSAALRAIPLATQTSTSRTTRMAFGRSRSISARPSTPRRGTTVLAFHLTEGICSFQASVDFPPSLTTNPPRTKNSLAVCTVRSTASAISIAYL
jgi:hypothetical protein